MPSIIEIQHQALMAAMAQLTARIESPAPFLTAVGEDAMERVKQRFATATGPDGVRWQANTRATIINYLKSKGGFSRKTGKIAAKGQMLAMAKRPLQGLRGRLASQFHFDATDDSVTVGSSMVYAAMQQFGGTKSQFPQLWGDIPARRFFPIDAAGEIYPAEAATIIDQLQEYLLG